MLTRQGMVVAGAGIVAIVVGRVFAVLELFVIGAALVVAAVFAVAYVRLRRPRVTATRWIHPSVMVAGDTARVDVHLEHVGTTRSAPFVVCELVRRAGGAEQVARLPVAAMPRRSRTSSGYRLPSTVRSVIEVGPLRLEVRDPLGIACSSTTVAGTDEVVVAPRVTQLDLPTLGQGVLGAALLDRARRLGPGDFHGLREYARGDEPRSIHWRASARTFDTLMVKEHAVEGLHRVTVVLDASRNGNPSDAAFERGVTAAASLVTSAARAGLTTRFVTAGHIDLRGPDVTVHTMRVLARLACSDDPMPTLHVDTGDGLGLVIVVTGSRQSPVWRSARAIADPTTTTVAVTTNEASTSPLSVAARSDDEFVAGWQTLVGRGRADLAGSRHAG